MGNAAILRAAAEKCGLSTLGGINAPYIWVRAPKHFTSWQVFDKMLQEANVVITPGSGFGPAGEGYFRISAFNSRANVEDVAKRLENICWTSSAE
jgi:LL-diaminopimelate aminotransferase